MTTAEKATLGSTRSARLPDQVIRWSLASLTGVGLVALVLGMVGILTPWLAWPLGIPLTVAIAKFIPGSQDQPGGFWAGWGAVVLAVAVGVLGGLAPHEHILGGRDSGTYSATAAWLAEQGTLRIESGSAVFGDQALRYGSLGFAEDSTGDTLFPQFMHLFPVLMALVGSTFGAAAMFVVTPVTGAIALLALFGLARTLVPPVPALGATLLMAATLPFLYFSRAPFSELMAMAFVFGGLWALSRAMTSGSTRYATAAGIFFGMVFVARLDGVIVLLGLAVYLSLLEITEPVGMSLRVVRRAWVTASLTALIGVLDGLVYSPVYMANHGDVVGVSLLAILLVRVSTPRLEAGKVGQLISRHRATIGVGAAALVATWLIFAGSRTAGLPGGPTGLWIVWYLGVPLTLIGFFGLISRLRSTIGGGDPGAGMLAVSGSLTAMIYLFRPSIAPDHIWASRRFLPVLLPALVVLGVWGARKLIQPMRGWRWPATGFIALVFSVPVLSTSIPVGADAEFADGARAVEQSCSIIGTDAALLFVGEASQLTADVLMPLVRGWCGVPAAAEHPEHRLGTDDLEELGAVVASTGRRLWIVGGAEVPGDEFTLFDSEFSYLEVSESGPPTRWESLTLRVTARRFPF